MEQHSSETAFLKRDNYGRFQRQRYQQRTLSSMMQPDLLLLLSVGAEGWDSHHRSPCNQRDHTLSEDQRRRLACIRRIEGRLGVGFDQVLSPWFVGSFGNTLLNLLSREMHEGTEAVLIPLLGNAKNNTCTVIRGAHPRRRHVRGTIERAVSQMEKKARAAKTPFINKLHFASHVWECASMKLRSDNVICHR